jgi:hypothetical protein
LHGGEDEMNMRRMFLSMGIVAAVAALAAIAPARVNSNSREATRSSPAPAPSPSPASPQGTPRNTPQASGGGAVGGNATADAARDGAHDFDFEIGSWHSHISRLAHPLTGSTEWVEYDGTSEISKVWNGRANLVELEVSSPEGKIEGLSLRLYNPAAHQWSLNFANSRVGTLSVPTVGGFHHGRGEFYDLEDFGGRMILVRNVFFDITKDSYHFEQAFSVDGGKTWEVNWKNLDTRVAAK